MHLCLSFRKELIANKGGIEITSDPEAVEGKFLFFVERLKDVFIVRFNIANKGTSCVYFTYYTALHKIRCFTLDDDHRLTRANPLLLCPGTTCVFGFSVVFFLYNSLDNDNGVLFFSPQEKPMKSGFATFSITMDTSLPRCTLSS